MLLPARRPTLNAYAQRFVFSVKAECLDRLVPLGEAHARLALQEHIRHYHGSVPTMQAAPVLRGEAPTPRALKNLGLGNIFGGGELPPRSSLPGPPLRSASLRSASLRCGPGNDASRPGRISEVERTGAFSPGLAFG